MRAIAHAGGTMFSETRKYTDYPRWVKLTYEKIRRHKWISCAQEKKFYLYALYNKNKPNSDSLMAEYGTSFFKQKQLELGDKMDLASYLLKPVQRMGKYALLLQQLVKAGTDLSEQLSGKEEKEEKEDGMKPMVEGEADLRAAEQMVRFQLRHGNDLLAMDSLRDCDVCNFITKYNEIKSISIYWNV